jgi:hypothetical protein
MEPNVFMGYLEKGIPMWPNEGIVVWPNEGFTFLLGFERAIQYPLKDMIWNPNYFRGT